MGNKEQGGARTGVDVEDERVGGRRHVLPEEELDLLVVRQQQLRRVKDCKALAGEYVTTQHKRVVFEVRMKKWKENRTMEPNNINCVSARMR